MRISAEEIPWTRLLVIAAIGLILIAVALQIRHGCQALGGEFSAPDYDLEGLDEEPEDSLDALLGEAAGSTDSGP